MKIFKSNHRYEIEAIKDPGFIKNGKMVRGLKGFDGCLGSIIGFLLEKIFHKTVSYKADNTTYYFFSKSVLDLTNRIAPDTPLTLSGINRKTLPGIIEEIKSIQLAQRRELHKKLFSAVQNGELERCYEFFIEGASAKTCKKDFTPSLLCIAVRTANLPMCDLLLLHGADVNERDYTDRVPLEMAIVNYDVEMVSWLIKRGADTTATTSDGTTLVEFTKTKLFFAERNGEGYLAKKNRILELLTDSL